MKRWFKTLAAAGALAAPVAPAYADEAVPDVPATSAAREDRLGLELSMGFDYSEGSYGNVADTTILYAPATARLKAERWRVEVTVPFIQLEGPSNVFGAPGGPIIIGPDGAPVIETRSGLGDVVVAGTVTLGGGGAIPWVDLTVKSKLPTAEDDMGTGEADYVAQFDLYQVVNERLTLMGSIGYQWLGDFDDFELEDGVVAMAGVNFKPSQTLDTGFLFDFRQTAVSGFDDQLVAVPYASWRLNETVALTAYAQAGLTDMSPDYSAGLQLTLYR